MKNLLVSALVSAAVSAGMFFLLSRVAGPVGMSMVDVPNLAGLTAEQARLLLEPRGLLLELTERVDDPRYRPGLICEQQPLSGSRVARGSAVRAKVVKAVERVAVPAVVGRPEQEARAMIEAVHLKVGARTERQDEKAAAGTVVATTPGPGAEVVRDSAVDVVVAAALLVPVPKVVGRFLGSAKRELAKDGFEAGEVRHGRNEDYDDGIVLQQKPEAGAKAPKGSKVDLVVNYVE